jgi:hypothetical protein
MQWVVFVIILVDDFLSALALVTLGYRSFRPFLALIVPRGEHPAGNLPNPSQCNTYRVHVLAGVIDISVAKTTGRAPRHSDHARTLGGTAG